MEVVGHTQLRGFLHSLSNVVRGTCACACMVQILGAYSACIKMPSLATLYMYCKLIYKY